MKFPSNDSWFEKKLYWLKTCSTPMNPKLTGILSRRFDEVGIHCADGSMVGDTLAFPVNGPSWEIPLSEVDDWEISDPVG